MRLPPVLSVKDSGGVVDAARRAVEWNRGGGSVIDASGSIEEFRAYAPLRRSPEFFRRVKLGEYGTDITWPDMIDMSADLLWHLAQQQSGATMSADEFRECRER